MRLAQLRQKRADARKAAKLIMDSIAARGAESEATDAEIASLEAHNAAIDKCDKEIQLIEDTQARLGKDETETATAKAADPVDPATAKEDRGLRPMPRVEVKDQKPFRSLGEQMQSIAKVADINLAGEEKTTHLNKLKDVAARSALGLAAYNDVDGGFLIDQEFTNDVAKNMPETGILAKDCRQIPIGEGKNGFKSFAMNDNSRADGYRLGGVTASWVNEADTVSPTKPSMRLIQIPLDKLMAVGYATSELLEDAPALAAVLIDAVKSEFGFKIDKGIWEGSGNKEPRGFMNSAALVTVAKESAQVADTINVFNVLKMFSAMPARMLPGAKWYINQEIWPQLITMVMPTGTSSGQSVFLPPGGVHESPYGLLFGRPIVAVEHAAALGDLGDIVLANLGEYALLKKGEIRAEESMHVRFLYDEKCFRIIQRVGGAPIPNGVYTPYKGAQSQSAFVTLQARA